MVIKNQNVPYFFARSIWRRQTVRLLDGKNPLRTDAGLSAQREGPRQIRLMIGYGSNEWRRERHLSMLKAFPFHDLTLWQAITSPPRRKSRIFESYLRSHSYSLVRDRRVIAGAHDRDDPLCVLFPP